MDANVIFLNEVAKMAEEEKSPEETTGRVMRGLGAGAYGLGGLAGLASLHGKLMHGQWGSTGKAVVPLLLTGLGTRVVGRAIEGLGKYDRERRQRQEQQK